ncbi:hypothetical protein Tco_0462613 [Tanacetum coccineum]
MGITRLRDFVAVSKITKWCDTLVMIRKLCGQNLRDVVTSCRTWMRENTSSWGLCACSQSAIRKNKHFQSAYSNILIPDVLWFGASV